MTSPSPNDSRKSLRQRLFYGRRLGPLLGPWIACLLIGGGVFALETSLPIFHEVVQIIYFIIGVILVIATARWFRGRSTSRRNADRRHTDRRSG